MSWYDAYPDIFKEVLSKIFLNNFFDKYDKEKYTISNSGVSINIEVLESSLCIQKIEGSKFFPYLSLEKRKSADAVIIQKVKDNTYNMHIFELTKKRKEEKELCEQFEGACLRALAVFSYFRNIKLNKVLLYFVRKETNTNPIFFKSAISNTKVLMNKLEKSENELEIENYTYIFERDKLKIKLLKDGDIYNITNVFSEYEINVNKNISHLIV